MESAKQCKCTALGKGFMFVAFGIETIGPWRPEARQFFQELSFRLIEPTADKRAGSYLRQHIGLAIQRSNAASLLGTMPRSGALEDVFHL